MPAPSAMTKPFLSLSKGRLALSGSSFLVESALSAQKPPTPSAVIQLSVPPEIIISASPFWIILNASPRACVPAAQAVVVHEFGPLILNIIEIWPDAIFTISIGIRKGVILEGPLSSMTLCCSSMILKLPMPEPTKTPILKGSSFDISRPESSTASLAAVTANCTNFSMRLNSFFGIKGWGVKSLTSPAMREV